MITIAALILLAAVNLMGIIAGIYAYGENKDWWDKLIIRRRHNQPTIAWETVLTETGTTQEAIDAVNLDDYNIKGA